MVHRKVTVKKTTTAVAAASPRAFDVTAVVDTSGSMCGKGLREAKAALLELAEAIIKPDDRVAVLGFNHTVTTVQPLAAAADVDLPAALGRLRAEGRTALYDAVLAGVAATKAGYDCKRHPKAHAELVVLTDGDDTSSTASFKDMAEALAAPGVPNFNMTLVAVGVPPEPLRLLTALCDSKKHLHLVAVDDHSRIKHAFGKVRDRIVTRTTMTTEVVMKPMAVVPGGGGGRPRRGPGAKRGTGRRRSYIRDDDGRGAGAGAGAGSSAAPGTGVGVVQYRREALAQRAYRPRRAAGARP